MLVAIAAGMTKPQARMCSADRSRIGGYRQLAQATPRTEGGTPTACRSTRRRVCRRSKSPAAGSDAPVQAHSPGYRSISISAIASYCKRRQRGDPLSASAIARLRSSAVPQRSARATSQQCANGSRLSSLRINGLARLLLRSMVHRAPVAPAVSSAFAQEAARTFSCGAEGSPRKRKGIGRR